MKLKTILFSVNGNLSRKDFWISILSLHLIYKVLDMIGNNVFNSYDPSSISFFMFFISQMIPRFYGIFMLLCSYFIAKKRNNEIGRTPWIPLFYVVSIFFPIFIDAVSIDNNLVLFSSIIPIALTFYLGLASPKVNN